MKKSKCLFLGIVFSLLLSGCSFGVLSEENANRIAIEYAESYIDKNELKIPKNEIFIVQTVRNDEMNKWDVFLDYRGNTNTTDGVTFSSPPWISISDDKEVLEYSLWEK